MGNAATLSKESNIKSSQLQRERGETRPQRSHESLMWRHGPALTTSQHWRWKNICSPKCHFPHWRGEVSEHCWKVCLSTCYVTPGSSLPTKHGWWGQAISLAANQCHCVVTFQENIPIQRNNASTPGQFSQKRPDTEETPSGRFLSPSVFVKSVDTCSGALIKVSLVSTVQMV